MTPLLHKYCVQIRHITCLDKQDILKRVIERTRKVTSYCHRISENQYAKTSQDIAPIC